MAIRPSLQTDSLCLSALLGWGRPEWDVRVWGGVAGSSVVQGLATGDRFPHVPRGLSDAGPGRWAFSPIDYGSVAWRTPHAPKGDGDDLSLALHHDRPSPCQARRSFPTLREL